MTLDQWKGPWPVLVRWYDTPPQEVVVAADYTVLENTVPFSIGHIFCSEMRSQFEVIDWIDPYNNNEAQAYIAAAMGGRRV